MTPEQATTILAYSVKVARQETAITAKALAATPCDTLTYKPSEKCMDAAKLVWHIASSEVFILNGAADGLYAKPPERPENTGTVPQIVDWYKENVNKALDRCAAMTPEEATKVVDFFGAFQGPAFTFVTMATNHAIHHRGQLSAYLRPMGGKVPSIYGPSGDEDPFAKATQA